MATSLYQGKYLRAVNKVSGFALLAGSWGTDAGDKKVWQYPLSETGANAHGFEWMLMPTSDGSYWIINRVSGSCLVAGSFGSGGDRAVWQYPIAQLGQNNPDGFKWSIEPDHDAFRIVNRASGFALLAGSWGTNPGDRTVYQYPQNEVGPNENGFLWMLQETGETFNVPQLRPGEDQGAKALDVPRLTSMTDVPKSRSDSWVIGEVLIPFMYVNDGAVSNQLRVNPYYVLARERYWQQAEIKGYDGFLQREWTQTIKTGITVSNSRSLENELSITISSDASFTYGMVSASLKTEIGYKLKVQETSGVVKNTEEETVIKITVPPEKVRIVTWVLVESFGLKRGDGSLVGERSEVTLKDNIIYDSWPQTQIKAVDSKGSSVVAAAA
jgi:Insecticidal Crystal Toxin, P42